MIVAVVEKPETERGMTLPCPRCGERDAAIMLNLANTEEFQCQECEEQFDLDHVREFIDRWGKVLAWVDSFPR